MKGIICKYGASVNVINYKDGPSNFFHPYMHAALQWEFAFSSNDRHGLLPLSFESGLTFINRIKWKWHWSLRIYSQLLDALWLPFKEPRLVSLMMNDHMGRVLSHSSHSSRPFLYPFTSQLTTTNLTPGGTCRGSAQLDLGQNYRMMKTLWLFLLATKF